MGDPSCDGDSSHQMNSQGSNLRNLKTWATCRPLAVISYCIDSWRRGTLYAEVLNKTLYYYSPVSVALLADQLRVFANTNHCAN